MPDKTPAPPGQQADLRQNGLLAEPAERFYSPFGFYLEALPFFADRRQRSDRLTKRQMQLPPKTYRRQSTYSPARPITNNTKEIA